MGLTLRDAGRDLALGSRCVGCGRAGNVLCLGCRRDLPRDGRLAWPSPAPEGLVQPWAGGEYDGVLRALVVQHKEHGTFALAAPLGEVLARVVTAASGQEPVTLVPVPSRRAVVRRRGHDPLLRVARHAAGRLRLEGTDAVVRRLLVPVGSVRDQAGLDAEDRQANLAGSMRSSRSGRVDPGRSVVVVDDVITTGATLREAQRALELGAHRVHAVAAVAATRRRWSNPSGRLPGSTRAD